MTQGYTIPVLDHGYVRYIDHMGGDQRILEAARISYQSPSKGEEQDKKLLEYLYRNAHTSPFEMAKITLNIKMPIFVMRQYVRHRMQNCLSGDNKLVFDLPHALSKKNKNGSPRRHAYSMRIDSFYKKWISNRRNGTPLEKMNLRYLNEETRMIDNCNILDIWEVGEKDVYEVEFENGYKIKSTLDHLYLTDKGYLPLSEASDSRIVDKNVTTWKNDRIFYCNGEELYKNKEYLQGGILEGKTQKEIGRDCGVSGHCIKKWMNVFGLKYPKEIKGQISTRLQTGRKRGPNNREFTNSQRLVISLARRGEKSNFWKGGISKTAIGLRKNNVEYNKWKRDLIQKLIRCKKMECQITGKKEGIVLHHIEPVWLNPVRVMDETNIFVMCKDLHEKLHSLNLEIAFIDAINKNEDLRGFFEQNHIKISPHENKYKNFYKIGTSIKLKETQTRIKNIKYIGVDKVYDLSVDNKFKNFVCNGVVVHNCNEVSARYTELPNEFYIPEKWRKQDTKNRQGSVTDEDWDQCNYHDNLNSLLRENNEICYRNYQDLLSRGVAREMARMVLPVNIYTEIYTCWDLKNLLHFIRLRDDSHAQAEIQEYGKAIKSICKELFPWTIEAYEKYQWTLSAVE